jgi:hypothetical protein
MADAARAVVMLMTPEEFLVCETPEGKAELVRGELRVTPAAGGAHACAGANILFPLAAHVSARGLGRVFADGTGYRRRLRHSRILMRCHRDFRGNRPITQNQCRTRRGTVSGDRG